MTNKTRRRLRITSITAAACAIFGCRAVAPEPPVTPGESVYYTFEKFAPGSAPESFAMATAAGAQGLAPVASEASSASPRGPWMIETLSKSASGRNALVQPENGAPGTPIVWIRNANYRDVKASVAARGRGAEGAPNAGLAWRVAGASDYWVFRVDGRARRVRIEAVEKGVARAIAEATFDPPAQRWIQLSVEQAGSHVRCGVDGVVLLEADDATQTASGSVGVCTFAGAAGEFDNLSVIGDPVR